MTREQFLDNWNNIDTIKDNKGVEFAINKTEAYTSKEDFLEDCKANGYADETVTVNDIKIGGISCYVSMQELYYSITKKHGKIDIEAYYLKL